MCAHTRTHTHTSHILLLTNSTIYTAPTHMSAAPLSRREALALGTAASVGWLAAPKGVVAAAPAAKEAEEDDELEFTKLKNGEGLEVAVIEVCVCKCLCVC